MSPDHDPLAAVLAARRGGPETPTTTLASSLDKRRLGVRHLIFFGLAGITPMAIVAGALPLAYGQLKLLGAAVSYMVVAAILAVFAVGLAAMARHVSNSGAFYAYVTAGLGRPLGLAVAAIALLAYSAMQIGVFGAFGPTAATALDVFGVQAFPGMWMLLAWLAITVLGQLGITVNARIVGVLIAAEIIIVVVYDAVMLTHPYHGVVTYDTLNPMLLANPTGMAALVGSFTGLTGFELPLAFAAVTRDPRRTMLLAMRAMLIIVAVLYGGSAWAMAVNAGPDNIIGVAEQHLSDLFFFLPAAYMPTLIRDVGWVVFATSLFGGMLAFNAGCSRYVVTLAREGVLPRWFGITRADEVPVTASATQSAISFVVLFAVVASGADPTVDLLFYGTIIGGLGILIMVSIAAVAIVRFFHRNPHGESLWRRRIAPTISAALIVMVAVLSIAFFGELLGISDPLRIWAAPVGYLAVALIGVVYALRLRSSRPHVYEAIGTGKPPSAIAAATAKGTR